MGVPSRIGVACLVLAFLVLGKTLGCGDDPKDGAASSSSGGTSGGPSGGSSSGSSSGASPDAGGSEGGAISEDDGLIPTTSIWRTTTEWYRPIDSAPVVEHSSSMIAALAQWGLSGD